MEFFSVISAVSNFLTALAVIAHFFHSLLKKRVCVRDTCHCCLRNVSQEIFCPASPCCAVQEEEHVSR